MAGHSKWSNIKRKKEKTDAQKGKVFTKIGRELAVAVREGGSDPENNKKLRDLIAKAKAANMPNDTIQRSIKKAAGDLNSVNYENIVYEGYGPFGVAVIVEALTDNRNRTASEMRHIFDRSGGSLGATGCVAWMFDRKGVIIIERKSDISEDDLMLNALDAGAEDIMSHEDSFEIITDPSDLSSVREALEAQGYNIESAELDMIPQNTVSLSEEQADQIINMVDKLEDNDDVQNVFHNLEM